MNTTTIEPIKSQANTELLNYWIQQAKKFESKIRTPSFAWRREYQTWEVSWPIKYALYATKSSEDNERQALLIDSQIKEMLVYANKEGLDVIDIREEKLIESIATIADQIQWKNERLEKKISREVQKFNNL